MKLKNQLLKQGNFLFKNRSYLPLIIIVFAFFAFVFQNKSITNLQYQFTIIVSLFFSFFGLLIRAFTIGFAANKTSGRNTNAGQVANELNTTGTYSLFRHPLYIGNFFMWLGAAILTYNFWFIVAFVLFYFLYYERIIFAEEHFLNQKFGENYTNWATKTNIIFPKFLNYKKPKYQFNLLKVLTQEKNGFTAIFILIFLFNSLFQFFYLKQSLFQINIWFWLLVLSLIIYLILKLIKNKIKKSAS